MPGSALAVDKGVELPASLLALLAKFGIDKGQKGACATLPGKTGDASGCGCALGGRPARAARWWRLGLGLALLALRRGRAEQ